MSLDDVLGEERPRGVAFRSDDLYLPRWFATPDAD